MRSRAKEKPCAGAGRSRRKVCAGAGKSRREVMRRGGQVPERSMRRGGQAEPKRSPAQRQGRRYGYAGFAEKTGRRRRSGKKVKRYGAGEEWKEAAGSGKRMLSV